MNRLNENDFDLFLCCQAAIISLARLLTGSSISTYLFDGQTFRATNIICELETN